jgi:hypothetical protein
MQRYKYINMIQVKKKQRYNELKYRGKNSLIMLNKDTEIFETKNINFSLLGGFLCRGLCPRPVSFSNILKRKQSVKLLSYKQNHYP